MDAPMRGPGNAQSPAPTSSTSFDAPMPAPSGPASTMSSNAVTFPTAGPLQPAELLPSPAPQSAIQAQPNGFSHQPYVYPNTPGAPPPGPPHMLQEQLLANDAAITTPRMSPAHPTAAGLSAQKRAYRQRRKDPSCDACRERKVKCDATDTSSCSECSSRAVKCQFTKETNRRMSSIKQVQDLEKQLTKANREIQSMKTALRESGATNVDTNTPNIPSLNLPETSRDHRTGPPTIEGFDEVRMNIRNYARGIFKPPPPYRTFGRQPNYPHSTPLPAKQEADRLLSHYQRSVHMYAPQLHWPTFIQEYENVYRLNTFQQSPHNWVATFFGVLACGTLMDHQPNGSPQEGDGAQYLDMCIGNLNTWSDELTLETVRASLLISIYFIETNLRSAGWMWLGAAVRTAQDIGLYMERGPYSQMELEMRRRVWWSVYNWDRIVSLEVGRPLMIDDDDCDVGEPAPVDDEYIRPDGLIQPPPGSVFPNGLISVIPVVRVYAQLKRTLKSKTITAATLATYDEHFNSIMNSYPDPFSIYSQSYLDPRLLFAACTLQTARLFLYRHNLSPACRVEERRDALERCVQAAKDTAHYVKRSMQQASPTPVSYSPGHMSNWARRLRTMSPGFFCTHLWRCALILCMRMEWEAALTIIQASASIGDLRKTNIACGRNLAFFLGKLIERLRSGASRESLGADEEMLAYASGDLQCCGDENWVWTGSETSANFNPTNANGYAPDRPNVPEAQISSPLTEREAREWGGWEQIQRILNQLLQEQQHPPPPPPFQPTSHSHPYPPTPSQYPPPSMTPNQHLAPQPPPSAQPSSSSLSPVGSNGGASRSISIKDLM